MTARPPHDSASPRTDAPPHPPVLDAEFFEARDRDGPAPLGAWEWICIALICTLITLALAVALPFAAAMIFGVGLICAGLGAFVTAQIDGGFARGRWGLGAAALGAALCLIAYALGAA
jgi:hypothetical protein